MPFDKNTDSYTSTVHDTCTGIIRLITHPVFFFKSVWEEIRKVKVNWLHLLSGHLAFPATAMPRKPINRWQGECKLHYHLQCANIHGCWQSNRKGVSLLNVACCNLHISPPRCEECVWMRMESEQISGGYRGRIAFNSWTINFGQLKNQWQPVKWPTFP